MLNYLKATGIRPQRITSLFDQNGGIIITLRNYYDIQETRKLLSCDLNIAIQSTSETTPHKKHFSKYGTHSIFGGECQMEMILENKKGEEIASNSEDRGSHDHCSHCSKGHLPTEKRRLGVPKGGMEIPQDDDKESVMNQSYKKTNVFKRANETGVQTADRKVESISEEMQNSVRK